MSYGKKVWIFVDGDMPPQGDVEPFGHEALSITNCNDVDAVIRVIVYFSDREPGELPASGLSYRRSKLSDTDGSIFPLSDQQCTDRVSVGAA